MKLFNSKTNQIETFKPIKKDEVSMYVCGPTVYNHAHIGNARPIVVFDLLKNVLTRAGYNVKYVSNYTDVDDKIINKALEEATDESEIAQRYIAAYENIRKELHADNVDIKPKVTETMEEIIAFIQKLIEEDKAYVVNGNVYFRVSSVEDYGAISNQDLDALLVGARIAKNEEKENPLDFVLWKNTDDGGITWDTPWGKGRPGWHTECVVMIHNEFNTNTIDIHGGGQDLKFPHHENESAQNKALHHHDLANYWVHNAMLNIDGEKMSKSIGNVTWAKDFIRELGANVTRWLLLSTHYRLVLNITDDLISQSKQAVERIENSLRQASIYRQTNTYITTMDYKLDDSYGKFMEALYDDLNIANAHQQIFDAVKRLNTAIRQKQNYEIEALSNSLMQMMEVLGLQINLPQLSDADKKLFEQWKTLKTEKRYDEADKLRQILSEKGYL
ncbi:MAG TPA: cysteine--tRNA ligase [Erysipelothrix sp.]